jgi:hypothetical protein
LVTAGRGGNVSGLASGGGGGSYSGFGTSRVAASITPTGSRAVLYLPNATTITINQSLMQPGYAGLVHCPALTGRPQVSVATHSRGLLYWSMKYPAPVVPARPVMYGGADAGSAAG